MAASDRDLLIRIDADVRNLKAKLGQSDRDVAKFGTGVTGTLKRIDSQFGTLTKVAGAFGVAIGIRALKDLTVDALNAVGGLGELASQLGVATETIQTLTFAGTQFGVSQAEIETGLARFSRTIGDAAEGTKEAVEVFDRLGIKILDAAGAVRSTDDLFREVIDRLSQIEDPARRASIGAELMGRQFQKLLPIVEGGARGLDELRRQAEDMGLIFSQELIASADEAADKMAALNLVLKTQLQQTLVNLAPLITAVSQGLLDLSKSFNQAGVQDNQIDQLRVYNQEIEQWRENQEAVQAGGPTSFLATLFGTEEEPARAINELLEKRARLIQEIFSGRGGEGAPPVSGAASVGVSNPPPKTTGKSEAEKQAERIQKVIDDLRFKMEQLGRTAEQQGLAEAFKSAGLALDDTSVQADNLRLAYIGLSEATELAELGTLGLAAATEADKEAVAEWTSAQDEAKRVIEGILTPAESYAAEVERLNELHAQGHLDAEQWGRALEGAKERLEDSDEAASRFKDGMNDLGSVVGTAFEDAALRGEKLRDVLQGLGEDIARLLLRMAVTKNLEVLGVKFGDFLGDLFSGGTAPAAGPHGAAGLNFGGPRAHGGSVNPGTSYLVGERGAEMFVPRVPGQIVPNGAMDGAAMGGGDVDVIINNYSGEKTSTEQRQSGNGKRQLIVAIGQAGADDVRSGGAMSRALETTYGLRRQGSSRG